MKIAEAIYGRGYIVTADDLAKIDEDLADDFISSKYFMPLDNYDFSQKYFFGLIIHQVSDGEYTYLPPVEKYSHKDFMEMANIFHKVFPNHQERIKSYLLCISKV